LGIRYPTIMRKHWIRQLYRPLQPAVKPVGKEVRYAEWKPAPELRDLIYCYWQLKSTKPLSRPFHYRVVSDGCIDIFLEPNNPQESYVMGLSDSFDEFPLGTSFHYVGIRFLPGAFPQVYNLKASELTNRCEKLSDVFPLVANSLALNIHDGLTDQPIKEILDDYFISQRGWDRGDADVRFCTALETILQKQGSLAIGKELAHGISSRQLRRLFKFYIGESPKLFSRIVRFQQGLQAQASAQRIVEHPVFYAAGYYDQSHFIKDFKTFSGSTPASINV